jgi:AraC-like DNA-binding protein
VTLQEVLRLLAASHLLLLALVLLKNHHGERSGVATAGFVLSLIGYLLFPVARGRGLAHPLVDLLFVPSAAVPFAFWFLSKIYFDDDFRAGGTHGVVLCLLIATNYLGWMAFEHRLPSWAAIGGDGREVWTIAPKLIAVALAADALVRVYIGAQSDLVEARLRLRYIVLAFAGTYIVLVLIVEAVLRPSRIQVLADAANAVAIYVVSLGFSVFWFRVAPELLPSGRPARETPAAAPPPSLLEKLNRVIHSEGGFRQEGLTITALARQMGEQEYKVRQLINSHLGFRNFSAFLNHLRIEEAKKALLDPPRGHLSIAEIAYQLGYGSLGPFNRAFREITGQTPTEFRRSGGARQGS